MRRAAALLLWALAAAGAHAGCMRGYKVGIPESGASAAIEDGKWRGLVPEIINELARRSGCDLEFLPLPRARMVLQFEQGQLDVLTSVTQSPERDRKGRFVAYGHGELAVVTIGSGVRSLDDLRRNPELKLGTVRGLRLGRLQAAVDALAAAHQVEYSPDFNNLVAKLAAGRVQSAILPSVIEARMRLDGQLPAKAVRLDLPGIAPDVVGLYLSRGVAEADAALLQRHLEAMRREGWIKARYAHHVGEAETKRLFRNDATR